MSTVLPTDKVLVQRAATLHSAPADMSTVQDTDLLLINRAGVDYKCSVADWKASQASINKPRMLTPANGAGQTVTPKTSAITKVDPPPAVTFTCTAASIFSAKIGSASEKRHPTPADIDQLKSQPNWNDTNPDVNKTDAPVSGAEVYAYISAVGESLTFQYGNAFNGYLLPLLADSGSVLGRTYQITVTGDVVGGSVVLDGTKGRADAAKDEAFVPLSKSSGTVTFTASAGSFMIRYMGTSSTLRVLHFADSTGLAGFAASDAVTEVTAGGAAGDASSTVASVDVAASTMAINGGTGTWDVGSMVLGAPKLSTDAAVGETPTFTSSAFSATGSVTHASSDWQVTLKTDTAFASPVVQSMADATHKLSWDGGPLQPNTDYIARVRHNGSGGVVSPWSDAVGFKTKSAFVITMAPSDLFDVQTAPTAARLVTGGPKMVQVVSNALYKGMAFGLGVDGLIYYLSAASGSWVKMTTALLGTHTWFPHATDFTKQAVQFFTSDGNAGVIIYADGTNFFYKDAATLAGPTLATGEKVLAGGPVCIAASHLYLLTSQAAWISPAYANRGVDASITDDGNTLLTAGSFGKSTVTLPGGVHPVAVHSLRMRPSLESLAVQASDGYYYTYGKAATWTGATVNAIGTRSAPTVFTVNGSKVKYYVARLQGGASYVHTESGQWFSFDASSVSGGAVTAVPTLDATTAELYTNWDISSAGWAKKTDGTWCYSTDLTTTAPTPLATQPTLKGGTWATDLYLIGRINLLPGA